MAKTQGGWNLSRVLPWILLIGGLIGLLASFMLTYDKIQILKNPDYQAVCNINPILSCGSVMQTEQASLLGVPNTIFGLMGFTALTTVGALMLAGATFKHRLWQVINLGTLVGFGFFVYLFFQGVYRINAICPYCFVVWMIMPPIFWYTTLYNLREGNLKLNFLAPKVKAWLLRHHGDVLIGWYVLVFLVLLTHFWYYWNTLL